MSDPACYFCRNVAWVQSGRVPIETAIIWAMVSVEKGKVEDAATCIVHRAMLAAVRKNMESAPSPQQRTHMEVGRG